MANTGFAHSVSDIRIMVLYLPSVFEILSRYLKYTRTCRWVCGKLICQHRVEFIQYSLIMERSTTINLFGLTGIELIYVSFFPQISN